MKAAYRRQLDAPLTHNVRPLEKRAFPTVVIQGSVTVHLGITPETQLTNFMLTQPTLAVMDGEMQQ